MCLIIREFNNINFNAEVTFEDNLCQTFIKLLCG